MQHQSLVYYAFPSIPSIGSISIWLTSFNSSLPHKFSFILSKSCAPHWPSVLFLINKPQPQYIPFSVHPKHLRRPCWPLTTSLLSYKNSGIDHQLVYGHTQQPVGLHKISLFSVLNLFNQLLPIVPSLPIHQLHYVGFVSHNWLSKFFSITFTKLIDFWFYCNFLSFTFGLPTVFVFMKFSIDPIISLFTFSHLFTPFPCSFWLFCFKFPYLFLVLQ